MNDLIKEARERCHNTATWPWHSELSLIWKLADALEKAQEKNAQLVRELAALARESVERDMELAKLEAEVMVWAKAEQEGRLVALPCKIKENCFVVSHTDQTITEITVSEFSYSVWHDAWVVAAANGCQFFLANAYRTRSEAEAALKGAEHE